MTGVVCVQCCALTETLGAVSRRGCAAATVTVDGAEASVVGCCSVTADDWVLVDWGVRSCARCGAWSWADGRVSIPIRNSVLSRVHRDSTLVRARGGRPGRALRVVLQVHSVPVASCEHAGLHLVLCVRGQTHIRSAFPRRYDSQHWPERRACDTGSGPYGSTR